MFLKTRAIVLNSIKFRENSLISYCYSQEFGRISLLVRRAFGGSKKQGKSIFFQPFNVLNLVLHPSPRSELDSLREVEFALYHHNIPFDNMKRSIALFLSEFVYRTVREKEANPALYDYIENFIQQLDTQHVGIANFHLIFMAQFIRHVGFMPTNSWSEREPYFDYKNGSFTAIQPRHLLYFDREASWLLGQLLNTPLSECNTLKLNRLQRVQMIDNLLDYYKFHLGDVFEMNSLPVLSAVFQ